MDPPGARLEAVEPHTAHASPADAVAGELSSADADAVDAAAGGEHEPVSPLYPPSPFFDQDGVHDIYRDWNRVLAEYDGDRMLVAEAWVEPAERLARYIRPDEMQQAFNFDFLLAGWDAERMAVAIEDSLKAAASVGAPSTWVLSNHDTVRHPSRFGLQDPTTFPKGIAARGRAARCRAGTGPRQGSHAGVPGAPRLRVHLPGRGAWPPRAHRPARRGSAGPDVFPDQRRRARPRRLPGAAALEIRSARVRLRRGIHGDCTCGALAAATRGLRGSVPRIGRTASKARRWSCTALRSRRAGATDWALEHSAGRTTTTPNWVSWPSRTVTCWWSPTPGRESTPVPDGYRLALSSAEESGTDEAVITPNSAAYLVAG